MFLLRMMFWIVVVIMLLPVGPEVSDLDTAEAEQNVSMVEAVDAASSAVSDLAGICSRNETVCETGAALWSTFLRKAEYCAGLVYDFASTSRRDSRGGAAIRNAAERGSSTLLPSRDTLTDLDRMPAWRGPGAANI